MRALPMQSIYLWLASLPFRPTIHSVEEWKARPVRDLDARWRKPASIRLAGLHPRLHHLGKKDPGLAITF